MDGRNITLHDREEPRRTAEVLGRLIPLLKERGFSPGHWRQQKAGG